MASLLVVPPPASAQAPTTFQYAYDATGQLVRVVDSTGVVIEYVYDAVGNMLEVRRSGVNPTQLTVLGFSPSSGGPASLVTIQGLGFSAQPSATHVAFNGTPATVLSATSTNVVARVPAGAVSGPISVTVGGASATSGASFTVVQVPLISAVSPKVIDVARPPATLTLTGANLTGSSLEALPAILPTAMTFGALQVDPSGTSGVVPFSVLPGTKGTFVLVATNGAGSSEPFANSGNTLSVIDTTADQDSDRDGFPDGLEVLYGSDPFDALSLPDLTASGVAVSQIVSVDNTTLPTSVEHAAVQWLSVLNQTLPAGVAHSAIEWVSVLNRSLPASVNHSAIQWVGVLNTALPANVERSAVQWFSVLNSQLPPSLSVTVASPAFAVQNVPPSAPAPPPPGASLLTSGQPLSPGLSITSGLTQVTARVVAGQTLTVVATGLNPVATSAVDYIVNDALVASGLGANQPLLLTVPFGITDVTLAARATQNDGSVVAPAQVTLAVDPDNGRTISGRAVDANGAPLAQARVELLSQGLNAEFFEAATPLAALPDLAGATPVRSTRVTAINTRNPSGVFGSDPFGTGLAPDYAARFTGWMAVAAAGTHTFILGAHEGAKLVVGGVTVVDMSTPTAGGFRERSGTVDLQPGIVPVEITFYESTGTPELQLSVAAPGGTRQVVPPASLAAGGGALTAITDSAGHFTIRDVPTVLDDVSIRVSPATGTPTTLSIDGAVPATPDPVDVGDMVVSTP